MVKAASFTDGSSTWLGMATWRRMFDHKNFSHCSKISRTELITNINYVICILTHWWVILPPWSTVVAQSHMDITASSCTCPRRSYWVKLKEASSCLLLILWWWIFLHILLLLCSFYGFSSYSRTNMLVLSIGHCNQKMVRFLGNRYLWNF